MSHFRRELSARQTDPTDRSWLFVPYDQLNDGMGPLSREDPGELGIVIVENRWKARRRPYHRQKLALLLSNLRHFALEQAERGVAVRHVVGDAPYSKLLEPLVEELGPLRLMQPAERELRADLGPMLKQGRLDVIPHEGWLTTREQFDTAFAGDKRWRMDVFYRQVRRETGILMCEGKPVGGKFSFDTANRKPWRGQPPAPRPPRYRLDAIKQEVVDLVERELADHPGRLDPGALPATAKEARRAWRWALSHCLLHFGPYEDAMSRRSRTLFHTQISALMNLHRLLPKQVVADVAAMELPVASQEGFIRQVLGWREFMHHVHEVTDGFRTLPDGSRPKCTRSPGAGGLERWSGERWRGGRSPAHIDGGACPSTLRADTQLPPAFWGTPSGLACLDQVTSDVWQTGYGHHITRLMVLSNIGTLLGVSPREITDWFWVAYVDAYDWVVESNVLGMGTFALGDLFTTKPYVSGSAYINRMSDYCADCEFSPKNDCPITSLYWAFLDRNESLLRSNPRLSMPLRSLEKRPPAVRNHDRKTAAWVQRTLGHGDILRPRDRPQQ